MCILDEPHIKICIGILIATGHWILFTGAAIMILISNDVSILIVIAIYLCGILVLNLLFQDCPITLLEDKFLDKTMIDTYSGTITGECISSNANTIHRSQIVIQIILTSLFLVSVKVFLLLLKHVFHEFLESR